MEAKAKHLEFLQTTINRMASNSFFLKGWAVTLIGALLALTFKQTDRHYLIVSVSILLLFWSLDGYYLSRERKFIAVYNHVRCKSEEDIDFSMDTRPFTKGCGWFRCALSGTMLLFYGGLLGVHLLIFHFS